MMIRTLKALIPALLWLVLAASFALAREVALPLTLDHTLLTTLLLRNGFFDADHRAALVGAPDDCMYVGISEPQFSSAGKMLRLEMRLDIRLGTKVGEKCVTPVEWHGYLELSQQPVFDGRTFALSFRSVDSKLLTLSRQPATVAGFLWRFAKPKVYEHLDQIRIDLAPPVTELRSFLVPLFHESKQETTQAMLDSLHGGKVEVREDAVVVELLVEVEEVFEAETGQPPAEMTPEERAQLVRLWETWDAFLVRLLVTMTTKSLSPEDRQTLIQVLLDTRYVFIAALDQQGLQRDFVRLQFIRAWRQLAPVFRRQLYAKPSENSLGYLAFFAAADALAVFDRMGPTLGVEISQQGLLRLAAMLTGQDTALPYGPELDARLRDLLQLPPVQEETSPPDELQEIDIPEEKPAEEPQSRFFDFFVKTAYAAEPPNYEEILRWQVPEDNFGDYFKKVMEVLADSGKAQLTRGEIPALYHGMFNNLIPALAWQESCFRQFVVKNRKLTYLLSYNRTSVGLMQINERVWRGVYNRSRLRWDIRYNARAGCEIVDLYLRKYALTHPVWQKNADMNLLSRVVYAMYNGGPGQYDDFLARERTGKQYRSDLLFAEKLQWVEKGNWDRVKDCF